MTSNLKQTLPCFYPRQNLIQIRNETYENKNENHLILQLIFNYMSHMILIVLKKKNFTTHLLLTNPTAVCLNGSWLEVY